MRNCRVNEMKTLVDLRMKSTEQEDKHRVNQVFLLRDHNPKVNPTVCDSSGPLLALLCVFPSNIPLHHSPTARGPLVQTAYGCVRLTASASMVRLNIL